MKYQVLITTSGIGSRLGEFTQYTNKSLIPVGQLPSISHIIDAYPHGDVEFVVTLGHFGGHIRDYLLLAHPERQFEFVWVDKYEGPGTSLVYSMLKAKPFIKGPFIFHASDTLIFDPIPTPETNWLGGRTVGDSSKYATLLWNGKRVTKVCAKGEITWDFCYPGISGVKDWERYWDVLEHLVYDKFPTSESLSDIHGLMYLVEQGVEFNVVEFPNWIDVGNTEALLAARKRLGMDKHSLPKPSEATYFFPNRVVKFFSDEKVAQGRVKRVDLLNCKIPKLLGSRGNFFSYQYEGGIQLSEVINENLMTNLLIKGLDDIWQPMLLGRPQKKWIDNCYKFYADKTQTRVDKFLARRGLVDGPTVINGDNVPSMSTLLGELPESLFEGYPCMFHGDFILENMLYRGTPEHPEFVFLDWRDGFGDTPYGDAYYDFAKLNHNLMFSHKVVNAGGYTCRETENGVDVELLVPFHHLRCQELLWQFVDSVFEGNVHRVKVLTALIWINMSPLHEHPLDSFLYYFGKWNLYKELGRGGNL